MSLFCDIEGTFGLILGSTLLTVFEIGDFGMTELWKRLHPASGAEKGSVNGHS